MRPWAVIPLSLTVGAVIVAAAGQPLAAQPPTLRIVKVRPFTVHGDHFRGHEVVRVVVTGRRTAGRTVRATAAGAFAARFVEIAFDGRCTGVLSVRATGDRGSRATVRRVPPQCPPTLRAGPGA
jgi:hypothetical protein